MKNGSKTTKIAGGEVMLKDTSFYKTSPLGDESATNSFGGNVITHVITGKTYFVIWSMDVKFEGQNVPRHMDMTTSNHASQPPGTPPSSTNVSKPGAGGGKIPPCTDHTWTISDDSATPYTADQKKARLRRGDAGDVAEAAAADHNKVTEGNCMSGPNAQSKLYRRCAVCGVTTS